MGAKGGMRSRTSPKSQRSNECRGRCAQISRSEKPGIPLNFINKNTPPADCCLDRRCVPSFLDCDFSYLIKEGLTHAGLYQGTLISKGPASPKNKLPKVSLMKAF